jgi:hypothetical protein|tara:strand:+ start:2679 stop:3149 length:471 start_codon:yes stop_codon:yes gene_type:complete
MNSKNVEHLINEYKGKIPQNVIVNVCNEFDIINSIVQFDRKVEVIVKEYIDSQIEIEKLSIQKMNIKRKLTELNVKSSLLKRSKIDKMRNEGSLENYLNTLSKEQLNELVMRNLIRGNEMSEIELRRFKKKQKEYSTNYNKLETENISTSNPNIWK